MKKNHIIAALVLMMLPVMAGAQALKGSYFLDNSVNSHKFNPAFAPRTNYFQLPVIGNLGFGVYSNLDMGTFLYPLDNGKVGTFLHPEVSLKKFERSLPKRPHLDIDFSTNILSFGFYTKNKAFWNFTLDTRETVDVDLPRDIFTFMKMGTGTSNESFNVGNMNMYATAAVQASLGYSREFVKNLRTGIKFRMIAPLAYMGLNLENVRLSTSAEKWTIQAEGYAYGVVQGLDVSVPESKAIDQTFAMPSFDFDLNRMLSNKVIAGLGYSFDIGARYILEIGSIIDGLTFSASVTDLGQVFYKNEAVSSFETSGEAEWAGITEFSPDSDLDLDSYMDDMVDELMGLANLKQVKDGKKLVKSTMPRFYVGVEMPFLKRKMSVGFLYSSRLSHSYARNELTLSYNLKPTKAFALGLNYSFLNTGGTFGAILELTPKVGPAFYIGWDYFPAKYAAYPLEEALPILNMQNIPIPMSMRMNLNFGIAFNMGSKYVNPKKDKKNK